MNGLPVFTQRSMSSLSWPSTVSATRQKSMSWTENSARDSRILPLRSVYTDTGTRRWILASLVSSLKHMTRQKIRRPELMDPQIVITRTGTWREKMQRLQIPKSWVPFWKKNPSKPKHCQRASSQRCQRLLEMAPILTERIKRIYHPRNSWNEELLSNSSSNSSAKLKPDDDSVDGASLGGPWVGQISQPRRPTVVSAGSHSINSFGFTPWGELPRSPLNQRSFTCSQSSPCSVWKSFTSI